MATSEPPAAPVLAARALSKRYRADRAPVLDGLDLQVQRGDYLAIIGESGVGKSTLLNLIAGLDRPDSGRVQIEGTDLAGLDDNELTLLRRRCIGFVFQAFHVLPFLTVAQNVALPLELNGVRDPARRERVHEILAAVGIDPLAARYPRELSGGELQRIAIARALVHRPRIVLADEPTGNLDPHTARQILDLFSAQLRETQCSAILITHSQLVAESADRVLRLDAGALHPVSARRIVPP